jgi:transketolase
MAAVSRADIRLVGSHCVVSIGQDGPSQMGLEDIAALRSVHDSTVLYPSCANQTAKLVAATSRPRIVMLAVRVMPTSGTPDELLAQAGIDRHKIAETARTLVKQAASASP